MIFKIITVSVSGKNWKKYTMYTYFAQGGIKYHTLYGIAVLH